MSDVEDFNDNPTQQPPPDLMGRRREADERGRVPPNNEEAERALLGAMLLSRNACDEVVEVVGRQDFYRPAHSHIFDAIKRLRDAGDAADPITVSDELRRLDLLDAAGGTAALVDLQTDAPSTANAVHYARIIRDHALLRRMIATANAIADRAYTVPDDVGGVLEEALKSFLEVEEGFGGLSGDLKNLFTMDDFLDRPATERAPWVVPGLIRQNWRIIFVGSEGAGKTTLLRQIAMAAAQGLHPLMSESFDPVRTLIVDLENPDDSIDHVCNPIRGTAQSKAGVDYDPTKAWLWWRQEGIDLRSRKDRSEFEAVLAEVRPQLVCLGPIYKAYDLKPGESDEMPAKEVMRTLDKLRVKYGFALVMEHHAPHGSASDAKKMRPHGSKLWTRWPEIGISLLPEGNDGNSFDLGRFRGDRLHAAWPSKITRSGGEMGRWPWVGTWPTGTFNNPGGAPVPTERSEPVAMAAIEFPQDHGWVDEPDPRTDDPDDGEPPF